MSSFLGIGLIECGAQSFCQFRRIIVCPKMHKEEARLFAGHVAVQGRDRDMIRAQGLLHRSDNWPFLRRGVPAVFLTTGLHPDYHTPEDDTDRIDFAKLERITELASRAVWIAADGEAPRFQVK